jgi:uncharacterized protein
MALLWAFLFPAAGAASGTFIYDHADLLTAEQEAALAAKAAELGARRETDFIIITLNGTGGKDIVDYVADFYDETAPGYDGPHGNAAILAIDLEQRDVFLAGFKQAEVRLNDARLDNIRTKITPHLSAGRFYDAFDQYLELAHKYMGFRPGVNPDSLFFNTGFQLAVSVGLAAVAVGVMAYRSGGRVTINARTYLDASRSRVVSKSDVFVNKTVTRTKIERNQSGGGGGGFGGGGGVTRGGHTFSGSRGKF